MWMANTRLENFLQDKIKRSTNSEFSSPIHPISFMILVKYKYRRFWSSQFQITVTLKGMCHHKTFKILIKHGKL